MYEKMFKIVQLGLFDNKTIAILQNMSKRFEKDKHRLNEPEFYNQNLTIVRSVQHWYGNPPVERLLFPQYQPV